MCVSIRSLVTVTLALHILSAIFSTASSAQTVDPVVRGEVTDTSGGVLPGVTVQATSTDGQVLATTLTDEVGGFTFAGLPAGSITLVFELDGFETGNVGVVLQPGRESRVAERLRLAPLTEQVVVYGKAPEEPRPPVIPEPPPPPVVVVPIPAQELESVCRPAKAGAMGQLFGAIRSDRYGSGRTMYGKGDQVIIDGGTLNGLEVGRNLVVRRYYRAHGGAAMTRGEHTAGLVQVVKADERSAVAVVVHTCNEVMKGDLLTSFIPEPVRTPEPAGTPGYDDAARILFADDGQLVAAPRRMVVIDRGSEQGIRAGQRLTLFRREREDARPVPLGEAVVVSVRSNAATIRVVSASDVIWFGDWAAPQR